MLGSYSFTSIDGEIKREMVAPISSSSSLLAFSSLEGPSPQSRVGFLRAFDALHGRSDWEGVSDPCRKGEWLPLEALSSEQQSEYRFRESHQGNALRRGAAIGTELDMQSLPLLTCRANRTLLFYVQFRPPLAEYRFCEQNGGAPLRRVCKKAWMGLSKS